MCEKYLWKNKDSYVASMNFKKACDEIHVNAVWQGVYKVGGMLEGKV